MKLKAIPSLAIFAAMFLRGPGPLAFAQQEATTRAPRSGQGVRPSPDALVATDIENRVRSLLDRMTLEEKLGQMSQAAYPGKIDDRFKDEIRHGRWGSLFNGGSLEEKTQLQRIAREESRLGIPILFGQDVIHGYKTVFPIPLGQAASWDPELVSRAARVAAREVYAHGVRWTFSPMMDIARDPRWGRIAESLGEDPYLASMLAAAMVLGYQGDSLAAPGSIAACAKHYVGYGAAEAGRDYNSTWIPESLLRDVYLKPFEIARQAGVASYMTAFNSLNGVPATANAFTLRQVLRKEWGFQGLVVSDYTAVHELIEHGFAADAKDAAWKAIDAGVDMEMVSTDFHDHVKSLIHGKQLDPRLIDDAVRNILRLKFRLGLFDLEMPVAEKGSVMPAPAALEIARKLAAESLVLLKNENRALPLARAVGKVAVIGPLADSPADQLGAWAMFTDQGAVRTPLAALRHVLGEKRVVHVPGLKNSRDTSVDGFAAALGAARSADVVLLFVGEEATLSGEAHSRAFLNLPGAQEALAAEVARAGKPVIAVVMAGRPLTLGDFARRVSAILYAWHPGTMGGPAIVDALFGDVVPSGKLPVTFPRAVGQVPIYYAHLNTGRPPSPKDLGIVPGSPRAQTIYRSEYIDIDYKPAYPFGFGLSYTHFDLANLRLSARELPLGGSLTVSADLTNSGRFEADEVVQLYTRDLVASVSRPVRELKGFRRVHLRPGQKVTVSFTLRPPDLAFHDSRMRPVTEPGAFRVWIAADSTSGLEGEFKVVR
ncbi:MAG: glycoside hydrolase family 3 N-terminal domain-containing protein [Isosphaeraceae bacterium]